MFTKTHHRKLFCKVNCIGKSCLTESQKNDNGVEITFGFDSKFLTIAEGRMKVLEKHSVKGKFRNKRPIWVVQQFRVESVSSRCLTIWRFNLHLCTMCLIPPTLFWEIKDLRDKVCKDCNIVPNTSRFSPFHFPFVFLAISIPETPSLSFYLANP